MTIRKNVQWDQKVLPKNPRRWSSSGNRPVPSPFPHTDPWATKSVLSMDGGGIRGYSSLVILQALMEEVERIERAHNLKATSSICSSALGSPNGEMHAAPTPDAMPISEYRPCHYYDFIAGTGTGGIIAIMLGRYRMSVGEAMEGYRGMCATIAERHSPKPGWLSRKHEASTWLNARTLELVPAWSGPNEDGGDLQSHPKRCRTIVCDASSNPPTLVINNIISQCLGANTPRKSDYDANSFYNNPSRTVLHEISSSSDHNLSGDFGIDLLSIGSAINEPVDTRADRLQHLTSLQIQRVHQELSRQPPPRNLNRYCRLDVLDGLQNLAVNEWKPEKSGPSTFRRIEEATRAYLQSEHVANELHEFATALVEKRLQRAGTRQWERWALGVVYKCPEPRCEDGNERFDDKVEFWDHVLKVHGMKHENRDKVVTKRGYGAMGRTRMGKVTERELLMRLWEGERRGNTRSRWRGGMWRIG
ncbi:MAG: hypothetical protein ASARMPREDX12_002259 [Alectoria sarmentosa]|nr:MAG: hypothetical protein ASARMPREDX12_002259 [Alectoria sarmentosa]